MSVKLETIRYINDSEAPASMRLVDYTESITEMESETDSRPQRNKF